MTITLYGLKNCDTCKKALKALKDAGHDVSFVDIRAEADLERLLPDWLTTIDPKSLVNTRSTTWRGLDDKDRARAEHDPGSLLLEHPTLIKRPVIDQEGTVTVGWPAPGF